MTGALIELEQIHFAYPGREPVFDALDLTVAAGDQIGLVAPNGSGKTTLFHLIMGLLKPTAGLVKLFGRPVHKEKEWHQARSKIGLLFQDSDDQLFNPTVIEDVTFGPLNLGKAPDEAVAVAEATLRSLGLGEYRDRITHKLSGGEKRLVALATILAMHPEVLLLDEPATGLDSRTRDRIMEILSGIDAAYILISHDLELLNTLTNKVVTLENGRINLEAEHHLHPHFHVHSHGKVPHRHG
jgi:cobalt/nickel transport system ATP-binding protein